MHDPWWMHVLLGLHISCGVCAFVLAPLALVTAKGGKAHRRCGKLYFWCMAAVACSALIMALWRPILLLALIAIFSFYAAFGAYRVLGQKNLSGRQSPISALDWAAAILCFVASAALALFGAFWPELVQNLRIPSIVFGFVGMRVSIAAIWRFIQPPTDKKFWWYVHLQGMIGSYIAALTAFTVVTIGPLLHGAWWLWLVPISIGLPAIFATTAYYRWKFSAKPEVRQA